jgi:polar amino acid transport system permease protein/cystine transport system permease protein
VDPSRYGEYLDVLLGGLTTTLLVTLGALLLALLGGLILGLARAYVPGSILGRAALSYIEFFRGTPVLIQLFILYFGLTEFGVRMTPLEAAVLGLGLNGSAYLAEVYRAGIQSIHRGQVEAAFSVGLTPTQAVRLVVLPQALRVAIPPIGNYSIGLLKDTAIVSVVAAPEILFRARQLTVATLQGAEIYLVVAALYLALSLPLAYFVRRLEGRFGRGHR